MLSSRVKTWLVRAAPGALASWSRSAISSKRQYVTALLSSNTTEFHETDLEKYLKLQQLPLTMPDGAPADILSWWKQRDHSLPADSNSGRPEGLPRLARMARQYHGEPATSAGCERVFSAAGRAHHDLKAEWF